MGRSRKGSFVRDGGAVAGEPGAAAFPAGAGPPLYGEEVTLMSTKPEAAEEEGARPARAAPRRLSSRDLLAETQEVIIVHEGDEYRLRCTSKGKLILTK
ncbi:MAG: hypothetical protein Kow00114_24320 [Kiloniellaceae bacterium]